MLLRGIRALFVRARPPGFRVRGFLGSQARREPEKCKESVFEPPILCQNQANPQFL